MLRIAGNWARAALLAWLVSGACLPARGQQPVLIQPAARMQPPEALPAPQPPPRPGLALADLEQMALASNPSLARAEALVAAARGNWLQVGLPPNPAVGYAGYQLGSGGRAEQHAVLFEQEIVLGRKLALNREVACQEVLRREQELAAQQQRILTDVRLAFFDALLAQRRLALSLELLNIARQGLTTAERLVREGETPRLDLLQSSVELESAEIVHSDATQANQRAWRTLTAVVGWPQLAPAELLGELDAPPAEVTWEESLARLLQTSPEVAAAAVGIDRARAALARARAEPIPNLRFQGGVMSDNGIGGKTDGIAQLLVPLPLFNKNQGAIRQAESELVAAERALAQLELELQHRLAPVYERYAAASNQARRYRERILPAAQESLDLNRRGWEAGELPYLNLLNAQRTYFQHNLLYLQSLGALRASAAEIEGLLLKDSLSQGM